MLDARHVNSNTDQSSQSWPLQPLGSQIVRPNKKFKSANDLMYVCGHATLDDETIKPTGFSSGDLFCFH